MSRNTFWFIVITVMFILGILSYPVYRGSIGPWPITYIITFVVGIIYMIVFGIFMWEVIMKDPNDEEEVTS